MMKIIAANLKKIRVKKNLTQERVAETAGISSKYLGEIERCLKSPTAFVVYKLSNALDVPICSILSSAGCFYTQDVHEKLSCLFAGREEHDIQKAIKILEVFFE
jgi:transcriptional regulator with XRE-family HTH domain